MATSQAAKRRKRLLSLLKKYQTKLAKRSVTDKERIRWSFAIIQCQRALKKLKQ